MYKNSKIPNFLIEIFKSKFDEYPSMIYLTILDKRIISKLKEKSKIIWSEFKLNEIGEVEGNKDFIEYDTHGIYIYINDQEIDNVMFLTTQDRLDVAKFSIRRIIKQK